MFRTLTHTCCFLYNARHSYVFRLFERTQTNTNFGPHLALFLFLSSVRVCTASAAAGERSIAFEHSAKKGLAAEWPSVGHPATRGILAADIVFLSLFFRVASGETAKPLLSCHSGTDDKAGLFTGRRDPGHGTHTYGWQEWKEGIWFSRTPSPPSLSQQQLLQHSELEERGSDETNRDLCLQNGFLCSSLSTFFFFFITFGLGCNWQLWK